MKGIIEEECETVNGNTGFEIWKRQKGDSALDNVIVWQKHKEFFFKTL